MSDARRITVQRSGAGSHERTAVLGLKCHLFSTSNLYYLRVFPFVSHGVRIFVEMRYVKIMWMQQQPNEWMSSRVTRNSQYTAGYHKLSMAQVSIFGFLFFNFRIPLDSQVLSSKFPPFNYYLLSSLDSRLSTNRSLDFYREISPGNWRLYVYEYFLTGFFLPKVKVTTWHRTSSVTLVLGWRHVHVSQLPRPRSSVVY